MLFMHKMQYDPGACYELSIIHKRIVPVSRNVVMNKRQYNPEACYELSKIINVEKFA